MASGTHTPPRRGSRKKTSGVIRTDSELRTASKHLYYEYWMMRRTALLSNEAAQKDSPTDDECVVANALIESFLVHVRTSWSSLRGGDE
jgi:hypothetical protein